jgi:chitinase
MANSPQGRQVFIESVVSFVRQYGLDGFDLDWEYPGERGGAGSDRSAFTQLVMEMRSRFNQEGWLLAAAVAGHRHYHTTSYDVPQLSRHLDFINVMAYDFHNSSDGVTGQNAPLYANPSETNDWNSQLNVDAVMRGWIAAGADPRKLIMGLGFYGQSFTLASASENGVGAKTCGPGIAGQYTQQPGILSYLEIRERIDNGWTVCWDSVQQVPYAFSGNQWVGYDSEESLIKKVDRAKALGLGGVMVWSIESDAYKTLSNALVRQFPQ